MGMATVKALTARRCVGGASLERARRAAMGPERRCGPVGRGRDIILMYREGGAWVILEEQ